MHLMVDPEVITVTLPFNTSFIQSCAESSFLLLWFSLKVVSDKGVLKELPEIRSSSTCRHGYCQLIKHLENILGQDEGFNQEYYNSSLKKKKLLKTFMCYQLPEINYYSTLKTILNKSYGIKRVKYLCIQVC